MKIKLSVFIPAHNEEGNLESVVDSVLSIVAGLVEDYEVLIIDDGSEDATGKIADWLAESNPKIRVIHHPFNLGFGGVQKSGYLQSRLDYVMIIPADNQFDARQIKDFIDNACSNGNDIVVGYRRQRIGSLRRKINTWSLKMLLAVLFGLKLKDSQWVKLIKRDLFKKIKIHSRGAFVDAEILIKAKKLGWRIKEIPTVHLARHSGVSHGDNFWVVAMALWELLKLRWLLWKREGKEKDIGKI